MRALDQLVWLLDHPTSPEADRLRLLQVERAELALRQDSLARQLHRVEADLLGLDGEITDLVASLGSTAGSLDV